MPFSFSAFTLQLDYPRLGNIDLNNLFSSGRLSLTDVAIYLYFGFITFGGIAAFAGLLIAGFKWLTSQGNPAAISEARNQILASFIGILLLLGSWLLLRTLDPELVIFWQFGRQAEVSPPPTEEEEKIDDGFYIITNHPLEKAKKIPVAAGRLRVADTAFFPIGRLTVDLSGKNDIDGDGEKEKILEVQFVLPPSPGLEKATGDFTGLPAYYYGIACFDRPNFIGRLSLALSRPIERRGGQILPDIQRLQFADKTPCASLFSFRMPSGTESSFLLPVGDSFTYFEYPYPQREERASFTFEEGMPGRLITGQCAESGPRADLNCEVEETPTVFRGQVYSDFCDALVWLKYPPDIPPEEQSDANAIPWFVRSFEIKTDIRAGKYLIFFFPGVLRQKPFDPDDHSPIPCGRDNSRIEECAGPALSVQGDVQNFLNSEDSRLYWLSAPPEIDNQLKTIWYQTQGGIINPPKDPIHAYLPKSCKIIRVEEVFK